MVGDPDFLVFSILFSFLYLPTLDCYFGYTGRRASTGSSIFQPHLHHHHHQQHTSANSSFPTLTHRRSSLQRATNYVYAIPISPTLSPTVRRPSLAEQGGGGGGRKSGLRVLVVDDNAINLQVISRILKIHMGDRIQLIELVKSGVLALEMLSRRPFDLVLLDIDMPILSGLDTAHRIRTSQENSINAHVPIVAVTTNDTPEWKQSFARVGMNGCISKPVVPAILKRTLGQVIKTGYSSESLAAL